MSQSGRLPRVLLRALAGCLVAVALVASNPNRQKHQAALAQAIGHLPYRMLWVWERPEDLRAMDASTTGVAILEETLRLRQTVVAIPRRQPLILPQGVARVAVVRIETGNDDYSVSSGEARAARLASGLPASLASLLTVAQRPGIAALSIDFDARRSERPFYRALLRGLRERMPPQLPLTITALASWCSTDDWIADLPVAEATPMFFRMEPDRRRLLASAPEYRIREPLCAGSVGVSTREPWPREIAGKRVYIFADRGWAQDLPLLSPGSPAPAPPLFQPTLAQVALHSTPVGKKMRDNSTGSSSRGN